MGPPRGSRLLSGREWRALASSIDLTETQLEIVKTMFDGKTEAEIAKQTELSYSTIHTHVKRLYRKLEVHSRSELFTRILFKNGSSGDDRD